MKRSSIDNLVAQRFSLTCEEGKVLARDSLERAQLDLLNETILYAQKYSTYYRHTLKDYRNSPLQSLKELSNLPFTTPEDIRERGNQLLCVSQSRIARVITMQTSGSTGKPKRLFFTENDIQSTIRFFQEGMYSLIDHDDRVLVLLPYELPASTGELLIAALETIGITAKGMWPPQLDQSLHDYLIKHSITSIVGLPQHLLAVSALAPPKLLHSMLLCSDYTPQPLREQIEHNCGCETFLHYGATESGLGGAVECSVHNGCHIRESDLLVEIIDPETTHPVPDCTIGEIVLTTLGREGSMLIRYRTGDLGSIDRSQCACSGVTARLQTLKGRMNGCNLSGTMLYSQDIDDSLFTIPGLLDYRASLETEERDIIHIEFTTLPGHHQLADKIRESVYHVPVVAKAVNNQTLQIGTIEQVQAFTANHTIKRTILDKR